jgi:hypothetical protein
VDLNGDGIDDVITGEYAPGDILFFKGTGNGLEKSVLLDEEKPFKEDDKQGMYRWMSTAYFVDWEGDGDLDMVVGSVKGGVYLNLNQGSPTEFTFGERVQLTAGGRPMKVEQKSHPVAVDWDEDGHLDILVGDETAGVTLFRGRSDRTFESGVSVFTGRPVPQEGGFSALTEWWQKDANVPGFRLRLAVADWNNDGGLDLLVGNCDQVGDDFTGHVYLYLRR